MHFGGGISRQFRPVKAGFSLGAKPREISKFRGKCSFLQADASLAGTLISLYWRYRKGLLWGGDEVIA
jgi:hypothetical protein